MKRVKSDGKYAWPLDVLMPSYSGLVWLVSKRIYTRTLPFIYATYRFIFKT